MSADIVRAYLDNNWPIVTWPQIGDSKGPHAEGWTQRQYTLADYVEGYRVGVKTGSEVAPGRYLHDVDIDWAPGREIAARILPTTDFVFGRPSKPMSHCFYTLPAPLPTFQYKDIDDTTLIELRGVKTNGDIGFQTMVPPSIWTKDSLREVLLFANIGGRLRNGMPAHIDDISALKQRVCMTGIGMILAKNLGRNGFGHEVRLAWAGFFLRAGFTIDELILLGESLSYATNNTEIGDVRLVVETTANRLRAAGQKIKGGPAFAKLLGEKGRAIISRINQWIGQDSDFARNADGRIIPESQENVRRAVGLLNVNVSYNEFSDKMLIERDNGRFPMEDKEVIDLWMKIDGEYHFRPSFSYFTKMLQHLAWSNSFHPVKDYLGTLVWDGAPRIDTWLTTFGGADDSEYTRSIAAMVLIAAVRRVKHPGVKFDEMLVLESAQGMNKSSALRALCPEGEWFSDDLPLNLKSQQMIEMTLGKWILEAADLAGKRKTEIEQLKAMLSRQVDGPARLAYAHFPVERARQFIIIGTTNSAVYLTDSTGARRFWPVKTQMFEVKKLIAQRDQMWAEAVVREEQDESIRLTEGLWGVAGEHQEHRREIDAWEEQIQTALDNVETMSNGYKRVLTSTLWGAVGVEMARRDRHGSLRISEIMQRLGYHRSKIREGNAVLSGYTNRPGGYYDAAGDVPVPEGF